MTSHIKIDALKRNAAMFGRQQDGSVAMIFALAAFPFCMAVAIAVDYSRSTHMNHKFAAAIDSATIAAAKAVKDGVLTDDQIKVQALSFFQENIRGNYAVYNPDTFNVKIDRDNSRVDITLPAHVPTTFARVGGFDKMKINQSSTVVFQVRDIEVGLALDVTGSMNGVVGSKSKIDALKSSFEKFAELMLPDNRVPGQKVRIGLAPYASSMNLGPYASVASGGASTDGCVVERADPLTRYSDTAPGGVSVWATATSRTRDIDPAPAGLYNCGGERLTPLIDDRAELIRQVKSYAPDRGTTAGHIGVQWAWNLVSPEWASIWGSTSAPDAYTNKKLVKSVILMTDGEFNTAFNNGTSALQAVELCKGMKARGILVFTLAFGLNNSPTSRAAKATLQECATPGDDFFVDAANERQLDEAFAKFAGKINALRIAQ